MTTSPFTPLHLSNLCTLLRMAMRDEGPVEDQVRLKNHAFAACGLAIKADDDRARVLFTLQFLSARVLPTLEWLSTDAPAGLFASHELTPLGRYVYAVAAQDADELYRAADALGIRDGVNETFLLRLPVEGPRSKGVRQVPFPHYR